MDGQRRFARVAALVLEAFVGPRPEGMQVCHFPDPSKLNNGLGNLRWGTPIENAADSIAQDLQVRGEKHPSARLTAAEVQEIRQRHDRGESLTELGAEFSVTPQNIFRIVRRLTWKHVA
jgi:hypothetical protein